MSPYRAMIEASMKRKEKGGKLNVGGGAQTGQTVEVDLTE
jgi:hypothetical protein